MISSSTVQQAHFLVDDLRGVVHLGRVEDRARVHCAIVNVVVDAELVELWMHNVPVGVLARGERLADAGRPVADADVALAAHGVAELGEAPVLLGHDELGRALDGVGHSYSW